MTLPTIFHQFSLAHANTFGLAVNARLYAQITSVEDLSAIQQNAAYTQLSRLILGGGSNIVFAKDVDGIVLHMQNKGIIVEKEDDHAVYVRAAAGENWHQFVQWTIAQGFGGLENLSLIPGTVGAAPIQNIGAYGAEVKDHLYSLTYFDWETGQVNTLYKKDCQFAYRNSIFKHALRDHAIVLSVTFALPKQWQPNVHYGDVMKQLQDQPLTAHNIAQAVITIRQNKLPDPAQIGNAGSFFKNPVITQEQFTQLIQQYPNMSHYDQLDGRVKLAAGWLIDQCGWKGKRLGNVGVYDKQALIIVNWGNAVGQEIVHLAQLIQTDVQTKFGIQLEPEPLFIV